MNPREIFLAEMMGVSLVLAFLQIPLLNLIVVPLVIAVTGFYYSYVFVLASTYLDMVFKPTDPSPAFFLNLLFKLSSFSGVSVYAMLALYFGLVVPLLIFLILLAIYRPVRSLARALLERRFRLQGLK